jgi:hypothetical protein
VAGRGRRALRDRRGVGSKVLPVAYAGKGGRREYKESARDVSGKENCATANRGGRASRRRQSQGWMAAFWRRWMAHEG